jgi:lysophospholipase L1-like esterase
MLMVAVGIVIALGFAELTARVVVPGPPRPRITEPADFSPFTRTDKGVKVYKPGATFSHLYFDPDRKIEYRINALGLRGADISPEKPEGIQRILCLGDSFTFGEGVREEDAWPQQLARILGSKNEVLNAGVQGSDLDREGLYLFMYGRQLNPDVVVVAFFMNDAMPFEKTVSNQAAASVPSRVGGVSALWRFFAQRRAAARETERYVAELRDSFSSAGWQQTKARIPRLRQMADHDGFRIVAMIFPLLHELDGDYPLEREHAEVRQAFTDAGIPVMDLLDAYRGRNDADLWAHPVDPHPNAAAHAIAAEKLANFLAITAR